MSLSIKELISDSIYTSFLIEERIEQVKLCSFPSSTPIHLLNAFKEICKTCRKVILALEKNYIFAREETERSIKFVSSFLRSFLAPEIRYAEGATIDKTPGYFVKALEDFVGVSGILRNCSIIIRPQWHYNYKIFELKNDYVKILTNFNSVYKVEIDKIFNQLKENIYIISFPGFQRNNMLVQTILGHEIGHPVAKEFLATEKQDFQFKIAVDIENESSTLLSKYSGTKREEKKAEFIERVVKLRNGFIAEILSDLVHSYLFSIAALYSTANFLTQFESYDIPDIDSNNLENSHPAWRTRLRYIYKELEDEIEFIIEYMESYCCDAQEENDFGKQVIEKIKNNQEDIKKIIDDDSDIRLIKGIDPLIRLAFRYLEEVIPNIKTWLSTRIQRYDLCTNFSDILKAIRRIYEGIPPNVINENSINFPKILNFQTMLISGLLAKEAFWPHIAGGIKIEEETICENNYIDNINRINRLLLKAMELSIIHKEYKHKFMAT